MTDSVTILTYIGRWPVLISARNLIIFTMTFHIFPDSLQINVGIVTQIQLPLVLLSYTCLCTGRLPFYVTWHKVLIAPFGNQHIYIQSDTKKRELLKNPTKIEEIQEKNLLTEIEPLQLAL